VANARLLVHDAGGAGLARLCEAARLPANLVPAARAALEVMHATDYDGGDHDRERYRTRVVSRLLTQYEGFDPDDLDYLLAKVCDTAGHAA